MTTPPPPPPVDPRLDWRSQHDPRSLTYGALDLLQAAPAAGSKAWRAGPKVLDQKREGGCVGWSIAHFLAASPTRRPDMTDETAFAIYKKAQREYDPWPGEAYSGTSVLAGMKAAQSYGFISEYRWLFGEGELREWVAARNGSPVVVGIPWFQGMYSPRGSGLVTMDGPLVGGHAILVRGFHPSRYLGRDGRAGTYTLRNSWGPDWGRGGDCYVRTEDMAALLTGDGEACVPLGIRPARNTGAHA